MIEKKKRVVTSPRLSPSESILLADYLRQKVDPAELVSGKLTYPVLEARMSEVVGRKVSRIQVATLLKACGMPRPRRNSSVGGNAKSRANQNRLKVVARAVVALYTKLGEPVPEDLAIVAK